MNHCPLSRKRTDPLRPNAVDQRRPLAGPRPCLCHLGAYVSLCAHASRHFLPPPPCWQSSLATGSVQLITPKNSSVAPQCPQQKSRPPRLKFKVSGNGGDSAVIFPFSGGFPGVSASKNLPAMRKTRVRSLDEEDSLEKGMSTHCSILAWRIPRTEGPGDL